MKRLFLLLAILCAAFISCNKNTVDNPPTGGDDPENIPEEYGEFELTEGTVFMTEDKTSLFSSVEDGKIVLSASAPAEVIPAEGTIIIAPITEKTPAGLLVKVVSVQKVASGHILTTEPASLEEAFEELHVDTTMDISPYLLHCIDNEGNITKPEFMTQEDWKDIMQESGETKAEASVSTEFTPISFPFEDGEFKGSLYMKLAVNARIDISRTMKVNSFEFSVTKTTGVGGGWDINKDGEWEKTYFEKELVFKPIPIPSTPLALVPKLYAEVGAKAEGAAKFKADVNLIFERQTYSVSSTGGGTPVYTCTNDPEMNEECFQFHHLTFDGKFALSVAAGGKICLYDEAVLAVGGELGGEAVLSASAGVSMEDKDMLLQNPEVALNLGLGASVYAESALFKLIPDNDEGRLSKDFELPLVSLEMHALPAYSDLERSSSKSHKSISGKFEKFSMIICEEKGFALFEEGSATPLKHIAISENGSNGTKAIELPKEEGSASFSIPDSDKMYETRPYAKAYGIYFYGEEESKWVDLGLPSGILWAKYNVGASSPEEYGGYYAWGETEEKSIYTNDTYKYASVEYCSECKQSYYIFENIGECISGTKYDVAHIKWGDGARMPKLNEVEELYNNCSFKIDKYNDIFGVYMTGPNGNSIFIPYSGAYNEDGLCEKGKSTVLWSSSHLCDEYGTHGIDFGAYAMMLFWDNQLDAELGYADGTCGLSVRAVKDKDSTEDQAGTVG